MKCIIFFSVMILSMVLCSCENKHEDENEINNPCNRANLNYNSDTRPPIGPNLVKVVTGAPFLVKFNDVEQAGWDNFSISFTWNECTFGGTFQIYGLPDLEDAVLVWGDEGVIYDWHFTSDGLTIIREDGIEMKSYITGTQVQFLFKIDQPESDLNGNWDFIW